jgi:hypothetical protein
LEKELLENEFKFEERVNLIPGILVDVEIPDGKIWS